MSNNENTALVESRTFNLPTVNTGDFSSDELAEDMAGLQLSLQKIKIPSGGGLQFELPGDDPEDPDYAKTLEGVILFNHAAGAYWAAGSEDDEDSLPLCSSVDGVAGIGNPGGACAACPMNAWGTGKNGSGKACKNMRVLYLLRDGDFMPIQLTLPPTSIRPFNDFFNMIFASRRRGTCGSVVQIGLKRMNNGRDDYSVATFKKLYDFTGEQLAQSKMYADGFRLQVKEMLRQRTLAAASKTDDIMDVEAPSYTEMFGGGSGGFSIADEIDGEREALPA